MWSCPAVQQQSCSLRLVTFRKTPLLRPQLLARASKTTVLEKELIIERLEKDLSYAAETESESMSAEVLSLEEAADVVPTEGASVLSKFAQYLGKFAPKSERTKGVLLLNVMTLIMATNWVVVKDAGTVMDPFVFTSLRFAIAALAFIPFFKDIRNVKKEVIVAGAELGVWSAMAYVTQSMGLMTTDASRASFLSAFTVILVPVLAGLAGRGISIQTWAAAGIAVLGTGLLEQGGGASSGVGDALSLLSAALFAVQVLRTEHFARRMSGETTNLLATSLGTTAIISTVMAVGLHPSQCLNIVQHLTTTNIPWKDVIYTGTLSTDLVLFIELIALNKVPATDAAIIYTMEPVIGALLAYVVLGERWGPMGWVGATMILMSSLGSQLLGDKSSEDSGED